MLYVVIKAFQDITGFKQVGDSVELDDYRAAKLRRMGLIGGRCIERAVKIEPAIEAIKNGPEENAMAAKFEEFAGIYPKSKTYAKKSAGAREKLKKVK